MDDADAFISQVICLRQTANDLQELLNKLVKIKQLQATEQVKIAGYTFSTVILRALATEIALKALSLKRTGEYKNEHDLMVLFNDLDSSTREIISNLEEIHGVAPLKKILDKHKDDFIEWRYVMEPPRELSVGLIDLDKALSILITTYNHADFKRLCVNS